MLDYYIYRDYSVVKNTDIFDLYDNACLLTKIDPVAFFAESARIQLKKTMSCLGRDRIGGMLTQQHQFLCSAPLHF